MDKHSAEIRRVYHIILSAAVITAGICLILGCLSIYLTGGSQIYTLEKIAGTFRMIAIPVYLAFALVIGGFILELLLPTQKEKPAGKNYDMILRSLRAKANTEADPKLKKYVWANRITRIVLKAFSVVVLGLSAVSFLVYALNGSNFHQSDFNGSMVKAALVWGMCLALPFVCGIITAYISGFLVKLEIEHLKQLPLDKKQNDPGKAWKIVRTVLLILFRVGTVLAIMGIAICLIVFGALGEGWKDVLAKAAAICTECVGLG